MNVLNQTYRKYLISRTLLCFAPILSERLVKKIRNRFETNAFLLKHMHEIEKELKEYHDSEVRVTNKPDAMRIAIKCPVSSWSKAIVNGDYHFAQSLKKALTKKGHIVRIDIEPDWYNAQTYKDNVVIALRGWEQYKPNKDHTNLMWMIYGSDKVSINEINQYDHVFVASEKYAAILNKKTVTPVSPLLQCSDPDIFHCPQESLPEKPPKLLFIGNTRGKFRNTISYCLEYNLPIAVYGKGWHKFIPKEYIHGTYIHNKEVHKYYGAADIVLNDHWDEMAQNGFISNRIFDVSLSGGFIISDYVEGADLFQGNLITYDNAKHLNELVKYYSLNPNERSKRTAWMMEFVMQNHTFDHRACDILQTIQEIHQSKRLLA